MWHIIGIIDAIGIPVGIIDGMVILGMDIGATELMGYILVR